MRKVALFAGMLTASVLAGGATAYTVAKATEKENGARRPAVEFASNVGTHFTAYEEGGYPDLTYAAENAVKGVVNIVNTQEIPTSAGRYGEEYGGGFEQFFDLFGIPRGYERPQQPQRPREQKSGGSGVIISPDGYIVTNNHVVENASKLKVTLNDKRSFDAKVIGTDPTTDVALIKIEAEDLPTIPMGDSDDLRLGEWVLAIGSPYGLQSTITAGIVSAKGRDIHAGPYDNFIQTDASINPGNSGGPLLNLDGEVIGINTAIAASGQGIGFAIPSKLASSIIEQLKSGQKVSRGWIGVTIQDLDDVTAKALGLKDQKGALIGSVMPNEPAAKAGLKAGDIVIKIGSTPINNASDLTRVIASYKPNNKVNVTAIRDGKEKQFTVQLGERNTNSQAGNKDIQKGSNLGLSLRELSNQDRQALRIPENINGILIVDVKQNGLAAKAGIMPQDIILAANLKPVKSIKELTDILDNESKKRGAIVLQIYRQGNSFIISIPLEEKK